MALWQLPEREVSEVIRPDMLGHNPRDQASWYSGPQQEDCRGSSKRGDHWQEVVEVGHPIVQRDQHDVGEVSWQLPRRWPTAPACFRPGANAKT